MGAKISFRHNVMAVRSIDTFLSIRGGFHNHLRDVYFVRGIGEPDGLLQLIDAADQKMGREMAASRLKYVRINGLPPLRDRKDADYYAGVYDQWKGGQRLRLQNISADGLFGDVLGDALIAVIRCFSDFRKTASDSMIRNFAAKLLFWMDKAVAELFVKWDERACLKVIADNVVKEQEYLFYLMLTFLGCDVLLIQNRCDTEASDTLKKYSSELPLGKFGTAEPGRYEKYVPQKEHVSQAQPVHISRESVKKPESVRQRQSVPAMQNVPAAQSIPAMQNIPAAQSVPAIQAVPAARTEKSFEELAQLASSVVMIAVHDRKGKVTGTGSGIMLARDGYILTNNHVASGGRFYSVRIENDEEVYTTDEVIKYHTANDLALIRIRRRLEPIPIYRQKKPLIRGQKVIAIGSPLGLFNSVSDGIISGFRNINGVDMIQFTAPISPGSSGGAVLNMQGEVIGISTAGMDSGQNINLAVGYESILMFAGSFF